MLGVVGSGTMGNGIAQVFSMFKHPVVLVDVDPAALKRGMDAIKGSLDRLVKKERMTADEAHAVLGRIRASTSVKDLAEAGLVVEAIVENAAVKEKLFRELDAAVNRDAILATNTSTPGFCSPIEFSIPVSVSAIRTGGLPSRGSRVTVFVT